MAKTRIYDLDLPPRCSRRGKLGKISYRPPSGGRITFHELSKNPTQKEIWDAYNLVIQSHKPTSLQSLADTFFDSVRYKKYRERTRKDHKRYLKSLLKVFDKSDFSRARPEHINAWLERRAKVAMEQANKELSFLRIVLAHAKTIGLLRMNPAQDVSKIPLSEDEKKAKLKAKRKSYVTNKAFEQFYDLAGPVIKVSMEILYCTGIRMGDLLRLKWSDVHYYPEKKPKLNDRGIQIYGFVEIDEGKGINEYRKEITPRLYLALKLARKLPGDVLSTYVVHNERGQKYTEDGFGSNWQYWRLKMPEHSRFGIHKIRSKAITDWKGTRKDKWMFSRHKTEGMVDEYDTSLPTAPSH